MPSDSAPFNFAELFPLRYQAHEMPPLAPYQARDGATLYVRHYKVDTQVQLILLHGAAAHSAYLYELAHYLSDHQIANVYTPDLRGHGLNPARRGDIDYIDQLEHDLADLIGYLKTQVGEDAYFIIGGHGSGGGLALRFAGSEQGQLIHQVLLLAPYLDYDAPMTKKEAGGWLSSNSRKITGLKLLNGLGISAYNGAKVLNFNLPTTYCDGTETLAYSYRLMAGLHPANYKESLLNTQASLLVLVGTNDESLDASEFETGILPFKSAVKIAYFNGLTHLGVVSSEPVMKEAAHWIKQHRETMQSKKS